MGRIVKALLTLGSFALFGVMVGGYVEITGDFSFSRGLRVLGSFFGGFWGLTGLGVSIVLMLALLQRRGRRLTRWIVGASASAAVLAVSLAISEGTILFSFNQLLWMLVTVILVSGLANSPAPTKASAKKEKPTAKTATYALYNFAEEAAR